MSIDAPSLVMPTNVTAEWSVLSRMLTEPNVIGEIVGYPLEQQDFSKAETRLLFAATVQRYYAGTPVDPLIVAEAVRDELSGYWDSDPSEVGELLVARTRSTLIGTGTVLDHAGIIKRLSTARRLQESCLHALRAIEEGRLTPEEVGDELSAAALQVTAGTIRRSELMSWMDVGRDYVHQLQRVIDARNAGIEIGVYTGLGCIDRWTTGIGPGELCILGGDPGVGKALALDTPIATRGGWMTMGEVQVGETVFDRDGQPTVVTGVSAVQFDRRCYRVVFDDGQEIVADAEHLWNTSNRQDRVRTRHDAPETPRTTEEIAATLERSGGGSSHRVGNAGSLSLPDWDLTVDPWVLGFWLGDGDTSSANLTIDKADINEVRELLSEAGYETRLQRGDPRGNRTPRLFVERLGDELSVLGLIGDKKVPVEYLRASKEQRASLLAGLVDSDGSVREDGRVELSTMLETLAGAVCELAASLGYKYTCKRSRAMLDGRFAGWRYRIGFMPDGPVCRLMRKRQGSAKRSLHRGRYIRAVVPVPSVPVRCIKVASPTETYLAGRAMIPTHNTALATAAGLGFAGRQMKRPEEERVGTLMLSMEMNLYSSTARMVSSITGIDGTRLRDGGISPRDYQRILTEWKNREHLPMTWNFASNFRLSQMRALISEAIRKHNVGFVIIDHFRMIDTDRRHNNPNQEDEDKVRFLKESIAKDLNVAVMCLAHTIKVGRGTDGGSPRPRLSDLRGSGQIAAHADFVAMAWNPGAAMSDDAKALMDDHEEGHRELLWVKNRFGDPASADFHFDGPTMRVIDK